MEAIDAGDVPLEQVIDQILTSDGLRQLVGGAAACFALARRVFDPGLFRGLIDGVESINAATREHVSFVVFHGNEFLGTRPTLTRWERSSQGQYNARYCVKGVSVALASRHEPMNQHSTWGFDEGINDAIKGGDGATRREVARSTESATTALLRRFKLRESELPCLVFVSSETLDRPIIVSLPKEKTLKALYDEVLTPLSDAFDDLHNYWGACSEHDRNRRWLEEARSKVEGADRAKAAVAARIGEARRELDALDRDGASTASQR